MQRCLVELPFDCLLAIVKLQHPFKVFLRFREHLCEMLVVLPSCGLDVGTVCYQVAYGCYFDVVCRLFSVFLVWWRLHLTKFQLNLELCSIFSPRSFLCVDPWFQLLSTQTSLN